MINDLLSSGTCPHCAGTRLCVTESEVCCSSCGAVLGNDYQLQEAPSGSKLNLYQATEVGTKKVNLDCARHIHENNPDISQLSNVCVKLDLPIYAAQDANSIYQKILRQKQKEREEYLEKLRKLSALVQKGLEQEENLAVIKRNRPKGCTRAHIAAFAVHLVVRKYGLPRTDPEILEAVRMNFGIKRTFTILKAYSLNEITAQELGIVCRYDKASYYMRLLLSKLRPTICSEHLYGTIERLAVTNLQNIDEKREDARARRALDLAIKGARLDVRV
ncbi:MAG: hypothetical protein ACRDFB_04265 [Rhabdochlamydiaceae bacterium]